MAVKKRTKKRLLLVLATVLLVALMCAAICAATFAIYINKYLRSEIDIDLSSYRLNLTSFIYTVDAEGNEILSDTLHGGENRVWVNLEDIPDDLQIAFISIEDSRFYLHNGVDWKRTMGAALNFFVPFRKGYGGGSTITQQLIKNLTGEDETSVKRKIREIIRATEREEEYGKED
ncbi:MAG: transglycosylase domain-containing protein, partial [Clostridia bacterium]|nr:transglycosylase domain-containing protein [Clostridia bacterium]